jgi:hypothetical protein
MDALTIIAVIALVLWAVTALTKKAAQKMERLEMERLNEKACGQTAEACSYIADVNRTRSYPTVLMQSVSVQKGEFGLLSETSSLIEIKTKRYNLGAGTRLKLGKLPIYLGGSKQYSYEDRVPAGDGDLHLTNKRIIFMSPNRSAAIAFKDIVGFDASLDSITIHNGKRQKPISFTVRNPALWSLLAKIASAGNLNTPGLADGVTLYAETTKIPGEVNFEARHKEAELSRQVQL